MTAPVVLTDASGEVRLNGSVSGLDDSAAGTTVALLTLATRTLTAAQIKALFTTPQTLVAAPGAGRLLVPVMAWAKLTFATTPYAWAAGKLTLVYEGTDATATVGRPMDWGSGQDFPNTDLLSATETVVSLADHEAAWRITATECIGRALVVAMTNENPTLGDSPVQFGVAYYVVTPA